MRHSIRRPRAIENNEPLGVATGASDATFTLAGNPVDAASLVIQVWQGNQATTWTQIDNFGRADRNDTVYVLDPTAGTVTFGDGIRGQRPPAAAVIVAQTYAFGGGSSGNLAAGTIKAIQPASGTVRHEWPTSGGSDGETVADAERRIPAFLAHRDRAVTVQDFQALAFDTPGLVLGRAEVVQGLMPGADPDATRTNVPGVISVFVFRTSRWRWEMDRSPPWPNSRMCSPGFATESSSAPNFLCSARNRYPSTRASMSGCSMAPTA